MTCKNKKIQLTGPIHVDSLTGSDRLGPRHARKTEVLCQHESVLRHEVLQQHNAVASSSMSCGHHRLFTGSY